MGYIYYIIAMGEAWGGDSPVHWLSASTSSPSAQWWHGSQVDGYDEGTYGFPSPSSSTAASSVRKSSSATSAAGSASVAGPPTSPREAKSGCAVAEAMKSKEGRRVVRLLGGAGHGGEFEGQIEKARKEGKVISEAEPLSAQKGVK